MGIGEGVKHGPLHITDLDSSSQPVFYTHESFVCLANKIKNFSSHTADSKPVKQEVNGTVIHPPLVFPVLTLCVAFPQLE